MQIGPYQIQVFISLMLILGVAFVALICDHLKWSNEKLRELLVEIRVRREEEHKRFQMLVPHDAEAQPETATRRAAPRAMATAGAKKRALAPEALAAIERGTELAGASHDRQGRPELAPDVVSRVEVVSEVAAAPAGLRLTPRIRIKAPVPAQQVETAKAHEKPGLLDSVIAAQAAEPVLPAGFQDGYVLSRLVESRQPVSGLVVSIGLSSARGQDGSLSTNVRTLIQSLIGPNDFATQSGEEEFLLIYPHERGADAQRRLTQVAQQLWDFQLRSLGTYSILFSWGGVEVRSESITEAIASATERMEETRRGRKIVTMEANAANG